MWEQKRARPKEDTNSVRHKGSITFLSENGLNEDVIGRER